MGQQSVSNKSPRSVKRRSLIIEPTERSKGKNGEKRGSMKKKQLMDGAVPHDGKIKEVEAEIKSLKRHNGTLVNKIENITKQNDNFIMEQREQQNKANQDKLWLKQRIERMVKRIDAKLLKNLGINFKNNEDWKDYKDVLSVSLNIIQKLAKKNNSNEEQYQSVSNKWIASKKENKELKKSKHLMEAMLERQKIMINDTKQQIDDKDKKLNLMRANQRNLADKIKKLERNIVEISNKYDKQIDDINEENVRLNVN